MVCLFGYTTNISASFDTTYTQLIAFYVSNPARFLSVHLTDRGRLMSPAYTAVVRRSILPLDRVPNPYDPKHYDLPRHAGCHTELPLDREYPRTGASEASTDLDCYSARPFRFHNSDIHCESTRMAP